MAKATADNGVNVQALLDAREALKDAPAATKFTWRASCKWVNGTYSQATVNNYFGLGEEQSHKTEATFEADHPEIFASEDRGITPIEYLLVGLASCLTAGIASVALCSCARSSRSSRARWTSRGSSGWTATCATATTTSR
jgi:hypothetical protein